MSRPTTSSESSDDEEYNPAEVSVTTTTTTTTAAAPSPPALPTAATTVLGDDVMRENQVVQRAAPPNAVAAEDLPLDDGGLRLHAIKGRVRCLCVNKRGTLLCAGGEDGQLVMWDFNVDLPTRRLQPTRVLTPFVNRVAGLQPIVAASFSRDDTYVVACQDGDCPAVVGAGGKTFGYCAMGERGLADVVQCKGHRAPVTDCCAHAGVASQFFTCSQDGTARMWDQGSFERKSLYTVKHGSGQIMDTVLVESVLSLSRFTDGGGGGAVFATAGEDGCVQLWDSRAKYRPGGAMAACDVYALPRTKAGARGNSGSVDEVFERHLGGMTELPGPVLAVRRGSVIQFVDLRSVKDSPLPNGRGGAAAASTHHLGPCCLARDALVDLPYATDTTPLASSRDGNTLIACTARAGFHHTVGGHVLCYDVAAEDADAAAATAAVKVRATWRAGKADEDVLCVAADGENRLFAGLSSGDVVVQRDAAAHHSSPVERWLCSRPQRAVAGTDRVLGGKSAREESDIGVDDLF